MTLRLKAIAAMEDTLVVRAREVERLHAQIEGQRKVGHSPTTENLRLLSETLRLQARAADTLELYRAMSDADFERTVGPSSAESRSASGPSAALPSPG